jgi:hypothetical protein
MGARGEVKNGPLDSNECVHTWQDPLVGLEKDGQLIVEGPVESTVHEVPNKSQSKFFSGKLLFVEKSSTRECTHQPLNPQNTGHYCNVRASTRNLIIVLQFSSFAQPQGKMPALV